MALQYIRPDADDTDGGWTTEAGGTSLFGSVDEPTSANDSDYIQSTPDPDHDIVKLRLSNPEMLAMRPSTVRYRYRKKGDAGVPLNMTVSLIQGASTTIASWTHTDISASFTTAEQSLTVAEFALISDFNDLFIQFDTYSDWFLADSAIDMDFEADLYHEDGPDSAHFLMHADLQAGESDGSTVFRDATGRHSIIANNAAQIDTAQSKFGGASFVSISASDNIDLDGNSDFAFGTGDFTIDFWVRPTSATTHCLFDTRPASASMTINLLSDGLFHLDYGGADILVTTTNIGTGTWTHYELTRSGTSLRAFVNGTQEGGTITDSTSFGVATSRPRIGGNNGGSVSFVGNIDEFRIIKGTAAHTANFTPPTVPYAVARGSDAAHFLMHANACGSDGGTSFYDECGRHLISANGNAQIDTAQSKFGGASALFDGTGDYLLLDNHSDFEFGTGDFTFSFWLRPASAVGTNEGLVKFNYNSSIFFFLGRTSAGKFQMIGGTGGVTATGSTTLAQNTWVHLELCRASGVNYLFVDGTLDVASFADTTNYASLNLASNPEIGMNDNSTFTNGHIDDFRIIKGEAAHTANFSVPTAQYDPEQTGPYNYLSCSRASTGYAKNSDGTLTLFPANALRIGDGTGLLVEDARTNTTPRSQEFGTGWTPSHASVTSDATTAPDGTTTADSITEDSATSEHWLQSTTVGTVTANSVCTASCYAKQSVGSRKLLLLLSDNETGNAYGLLDLSNGNASTLTADGEWTSVSASSETLANGWYRLILTGTLGATRDNLRLYVALSDGTTSYAGNGTSTIHVWGAQSEQGAFASSYIPTTSSSATRAADVVESIGALRSTAIGTTKSFVTDLKTLVAPTAQWRLLPKEDGDQSFFMSDTASNTVIVAWNGSSSINATIGNSLTLSGGVKLGASQETGVGRSIVGGGGTVASDANSISSLNAIRLGYGAAASTYSYVYWRRFTAWTSRLADATLQGHTQP